MSTIRNHPKPVTRRSLFKTAAALTVAVSLPKVAFAQTKTLTSTIFGGKLEEVYRETIVKPFEQKFGAEVTLTYGAPGQWLTSAIVNQDNPEIDLLWLTAPENIQAVIEDICVELSPNDIPNLNNVDPVWYEGLRRKGVGFNYAPYGIGYRTDMLAKAPTSWADFWSPELAGQISIPDITAPAGITFLVVAAQLNGGSENNIDPGFEAIKRLKPNIRRLYKNNVEAAQLLERGEVAMLPIPNGRALGLSEAGLPVRWVAPIEGCNPGPVSLHVPKGTKDKELCYQYIDHAISAEAQTAFCEAMRYGSVNKLVTLSPAAQEWVPPLSSLKDNDWYTILPQRGSWIERWNREIAS